MYTYMHTYIHTYEGPGSQVQSREPRAHLHAGAGHGRRAGRSL